MIDIKAATVLGQWLFNIRRVILYSRGFPSFFWVQAAILDRKSVSARIIVIAKNYKQLINVREIPINDLIVVVLGCGGSGAVYILKLVGDSHISYISIGGLECDIW